MIMIVFLLGIISGNYAYQYMADSPDYLIALERSYFQLFSCIGLYFFLKITGRLKDK